MRIRSLAPLPGHIHPSATAYRAGCGCIKCFTKTKGDQARRARFGSTLVEAEPVRAWLSKLINEGFSYSQVSSATGVPESIIGELFNPNITRNRIQMKSARALRTVTRADLYRIAVDRAAVPSVGSLRRLQALQRIGWPLRALCENDRQYHQISKIASMQRSTILARYHRLIIGMYDSHWDKPGPSNRVRLRAVKFGYAPPLTWDDETIDDPEAEPNYGPPTHVTDAAAARFHKFREEFVALINEGRTPSEACSEMGLSAAAAYKRFHRWAPKDPIRFTLTKALREAS